jgi:2-amino-4-hydroxy-6-hydroxymethyldihydropteridine diphosphokinase
VAIHVAIALGSNLGNRAQQLTAAVDALRTLIPDIRVSQFIDTAPVAVYENGSTPFRDVGEPPRFLNAAAVGSTDLPAAGLLAALLAIEQRFGRVRPYPGAARTIDLDLILYGNAVIEEPGLVVPHPRFRERLFVLEPLAEIAGEWVDPVTGKTVADLMRALRPSCA